MLVSVDTKVRYKGVEYSSLAEIPPEIRRPLDRAVSRLTCGREIMPHLNSRIILNGETVTNPDRLSDEERRLSLNRSRRCCRSTAPSASPQ